MFFFSLKSKIWRFFISIIDCHKWARMSLIARQIRPIHVAAEAHQSTSHPSLMEECGAAEVRVGRHTWNALYGCDTKKWYSQVIFNFFNKFVYYNPSLWSQILLCEPDVSTPRILHLYWHIYCHKMRLEFYERSVTWRVVQRIETSLYFVVNSKNGSIFLLPNASIPNAARLKR